MIKGKFGQARCEGCHSWHFAVLLNDKNEIVELKCCRCSKIYPYPFQTTVKPT